jgi:hypothetical protein
VLAVNAHPHELNWSIQRTAGGGDWQSKLAPACNCAKKAFDHSAVGYEPFQVGRPNPHSGGIPRAAQSPQSALN